MANSWLSSAHPQAATWEPPLRRRGTRMVSDWLRRHFYEAFLPLLALLDGALIMGVFLLTYALRFRWHLLAAAAAPPWVPYLWGMLFVSCIWTATLVGIGFYAPRRSPSKFDDLVLLIWGLMLGGMASVALGFFYRDFSYSRLVIAYGFLLCVIVLGAWHLLLRLAQARVQAHGWLALNTLVVGCNNLGATIASRLAHSPRLGYRVVGFLPAPGEEQGQQDFFFPLPEAEAPAVPVGCTRILGNSRQLGEVLDRYAIDEVVLAQPGASFGDFFDMMSQAYGVDVQFRIVPDLVELVTANIRLNHLAGVPTLEIAEIPLRYWQNRVCKRGLDAMLSAVALLCLSPLLVLVAIGVKLSSPGPIFYRQERLGRDGRTFEIYKFRTMVIDAEQKSGPVWATAEDPRCTPLGVLLRRFSIDELPQIWNVLRGDMSLVGPRPERPFFVDRFRQYIPKYMDRHLVRSGLTGWAQLNGLRGEEGTIEERTRYDIYYIENWSMLFDLKIIASTLVRILANKL